jgi:hypothetical protein
LTTHKRVGRDDYLRDPSSRLIGSRRSRRRLLAELCEHIEESIATKVEVGIARADAERQALAQLGDVSTVAGHWHERTVRPADAETLAWLSQSRSRQSPPSSVLRAPPTAAVTRRPSAAPIPPQTPTTAHTMAPRPSRQRKSARRPIVDGCARLVGSREWLYRQLEPARVVVELAENDQVIATQLPR